MDGRMFVSVEILVEREGRFLLIVRSDEEEFGAGWLTLPGGKLEPGEMGLLALEVTAQRELKEEVDLDVSLEDIRYVESHVFGVDNVPVLDVVMATREARGEPRAVDAAEVAGVMWLTAEEIAAHPDVPEWTRTSVTLAVGGAIT